MSVAFVHRCDCCRGALRGTLPLGYSVPCCLILLSEAGYVIFTVTAQSCFFSPPIYSSPLIDMAGLA